MDMAEVKIADEPDRKFILLGQAVCECYVFSTEFGDFAVPVNEAIKVKHHPIFDTRKEANYAKVVKRLKNGTNIDKYRSSKYYTYYLERLKKEYPEYVV